MLPMKTDYPAPPMGDMNPMVGGSPGIPPTDQGSPEQQPLMMLPTAQPQLPVTPGPVGYGAMGQSPDSPAPMGMPGPPMNPPAGGGAPPMPPGPPMPPPGPPSPGGQAPTASLDPQTLARILSGGA